MQPTAPSICCKDRQIVRELARQVAEIAARPIMAARRDLWRRHNALEPVRPVIYVDPQGAWCELTPDGKLLGRDKMAREIELAPHRIPGWSVDLNASQKQPAAE